MADTLEPRNAQDLSQHTRVEELKKRGIKPTNFPDEDAKLLQREFNKEFDVEKEERAKRRAEEAEKRRAAEQAEKRKRQLERQLADEADAVATNHRVSVWVDLVERNATPADMIIDIDDTVAIRAFVKTLSPNISLRSLDLCRCGLRDDVGVELAHALRSNHGLLKLQADGNFFTSTTTKAIGQMLQVNQTLLVLSLEHNPLTSKQRNYTGLEELCSALKTNTSLQNLSLFQCALGTRGGELLRDVMEENTTLLRLQISNTDGVRIQDAGYITDRLRENREQLLALRARAKAERAQQRKQEEKETAEQEAAARQRAESEWIEGEKKKREAKRQEIQIQEMHADREARLAREHKEAKWREKEKAKKEAAAKRAAKKKEKKK